MDQFAPFPVLDTERTYIVGFKEKESIQGHSIGPITVIDVDLYKKSLLDPDIKPEAEIEETMIPMGREFVGWYTRYL